jgi:hypothetical protein
MTDATTDDQEVTARERSSWVFRNARILVLALILLLVAGLLVGVSFAVFSTSSANAGNVFTAGSLSSSNSKNGAILTAANMVPGDTVEGTVTIKNTGDSEGAFRLSSSTPTDTAGPNGGKLSTVLDLRVVQDPGATSKVVYDGKFNAMTTPVNVGTWAGGAEHTFEFTVTFPDGGTPGGPTTGDNAYQGSSTTVEYTWSATST